MTYFRIHEILVFVRMKFRGISTLKANNKGGNRKQVCYSCFISFALNFAF